MTRVLPDPGGRVNTGVVQFKRDGGVDWPGIFIRGDNAVGMAGTLDALIEQHKELPPSVVRYLRELEALLGSCNMND